MYESLTKFIPFIEKADTYGEWFIDRKHTGTADDPWRMPFVNYSDVVNAFRSALGTFVDDHPNMQLTSYGEILEESGISWGFEPMENVDVSNFSSRTVMALLVGAVRAERFCDGALLHFFENGCITRWLQRLEEIDGVSSNH